MYGSRHEHAVISKHYIWSEDLGPWVPRPANVDRHRFAAFDGILVCYRQKSEEEKTEVERYWNGRRV